MRAVRCLLTAALLLALVLPALHAADLTYPCHRNPTPPTLDGHVAGDPGWANIPGVTGFHRLGGGYTVAKQTVAHVTWDDDRLYVAMIAEEPDIAHVEPTMRDGGDCWLDDGVEVFVQPAGRGPFQFVATTGGARTSGEGAAPLDAWEVATSQTDDTYTIELAISFEAFGVRPQAGDVWSINFCRNTFVYDSGGDKFTTWAPLEGRFLEPERFAPLRFEPGPLSEEQARRAEERLNADYRATLLRDLAALAGKADDHLPFLMERARDERHRPRAAPLRAEWRRVLRIQREADTAPLADIRAVLSRAERLQEASHQFRYETLIEELFED